MSDTGQVVRIRIFGQEYPVKAKVNDEEYIRAIGRYVDTKMREIDEAVKPASKDKTAILAALNIADELFNLQNEQDRLIAEYQDKIRSYTEAIEQSLDE